MTSLGLGARMVAAATIIAAMNACARAMPPPGGEPDQSPPQVVATTPEQLSVVDPFDGAVVFEFDERLSERNIEGAVIVSPATGEVHVSRNGSELRVSIDGGWREGVVYRVLLLPGIRDLFNNERRSPVDLVFSTGPAIVNTAFGGLISDRITGRPEPLAMVEATRRADSLVYVATVDSLGFFAYRNLPLGIYNLVAYADRNRNRRLDPGEPLTSPRVVTLNTERDTVDLDLAVVPNDTTPARLIRAEGRDSLQVRLFTDDHIDPERSLNGIEVQLMMLPDSEAVVGPFQLVRADSFAELVRARTDSLRLDSLRTAAAAGDTAAARRLEAPQPPPLQPRAGPAGALPSIGPSPFQELVLVPARPLLPGRYEVTVSNLLNISMRPGGGGKAEFEIRPPPPPVESPPVRPDTSASVRTRKR
ncbi:MAG TPA: Ig-like domain-containing protein [Longimicrobiales bacterium]|nr:Ig-like domain-containing protein [Longimicrobiales bacterium]